PGRSWESAMLINCSCGCASSPPRSASSPRPRPLSFAMDIARWFGQHLSRESQIREGPLRLPIESDDWDSMARSLCKANVTGDDGPIDFVAKVLLQLIGNLLRQCVTRIVHGAQQAFDL